MKLVAVIGIPHTYHGEVVKACVVLRENANVSTAELDAHCASSLAEYKRPRHIEIRAQLPTSAVGKVLYRVLREEHASAQTPVVKG